MSGRDECVHGSLRRACEPCALTEEVQTARARVADLERERDEAAQDAQCRLAVSHRLYESILKVLKPHFPKDSRDLEWDVLPRTLGNLVRERDEARSALGALRQAVQNALPLDMTGWGTLLESVPKMGMRLAKAEADAARLREALTQVRDAMLATGQGPDGDDDPRRPVATAVWRALASAPSAETWRQVGQHAAHPELDATPSAEPTPRAKAEAFFAGFAGDDDAGVLAWSEPSAEPTPRDMRVAEAVRARIARHIRISPRFEGQLTTPNDNGLLGRVAQEVENLDLAAVVAKAVGT